MSDGMWKLNVMTIIKSDMKLFLIFLSLLIYGMVD